MRQAVAVALAVAGSAAMALGGCSPQAAKEPPPAAFSDRPALPSCGRMQAQGPDFTFEELYPREVIDCLVDSREHGGSELSVTTITTEGDPITTYYRVADRSTAVEIFVDKSADAYAGGPGWTQLTCDVPTLTSESLRACHDSI